MVEKNLKNRSFEYHKIYSQQVIPLFRDFENARLIMLDEFKRKSFLKYLLPNLIFAVLAIFGLTKLNETYGFALVLIFGGILPSTLLAAAIFYYSARKKEYQKFAKILKTNVLKNLLSVFGDIKWIGHNALEENTFDTILKDSKLRDSGLFISYNTRYTDDEFKGSYNGIPFVISETKMFDTHGSGKNSRSICAFEGVILAFKFNKLIRNRTIVSTKGDLTKKNQALCTALLSSVIFIDIFKDGYAHWKLLLILGIFLVVFFISKSMEQKEEALDEIKLEDSKFSDRFNVYSSDQVEARYLVTPAFMEKFYNLKTAFGTKKIKCSFFDDTLMIAINTTKNLFEIGNLFKSLEDVESITEFYKELDSIYKIADYFKLNEEIYISSAKNTDYDKYL